MKINRIIRHRSTGGPAGVNLAASIDAAISVNINESRSARSQVSTRRTIVQRSTARSTVNQEGVHDEATREGP